MQNEECKLQNYKLPFAVLILLTNNLSNSSQSLYILLNSFSFMISAACNTFNQKSVYYFGFRDFRCFTFTHCCSNLLMKYSAFIILHSAFASQLYPNSSRNLLQKFRRGNYHLKIFPDSLSQIYQNNSRVQYNRYCIVE